MGTLDGLPGRLMVVVFLLWAMGPVHAATYHVDPKTGSMSNSGGANSPWRTLAEVLKSKLGQVKGGDTILLRTGYHGAVQINGRFNDKVITVSAAEGHAPKLGRLRVNESAKWLFRGLEISPSLAPTFKAGTIVSLGSRRGKPSSELTVEDCFIYSVLDHMRGTPDRVVHVEVGLEDAQA